MRHLLAAMPVAFVLAACGTAPAPSQAPAQAARVQSPTAPCIVHVYRNKTAYHSRNPEQPFVYVGDEQAGTLGVGQSQCLRLAPGKYVLSIRQPVLFMPGITSDRLEIEVTEGTPVYIRYAKEFTGVTPAGGTRDRGRLQLVSEPEWRARQ